MSKMINLAEKEIARKEILLLCQEADEVGCSKEVLKTALGKCGLNPELNVDMEIRYLEEKGLLRVNRVENKRLGIRREIVFLTAQGMDYLDGTGEDIPGIGV